MHQRVSAHSRRAERFISISCPGLRLRIFFVFQHGTIRTGYIGIYVKYDNSREEIIDVIDMLKEYFSTFISISYKELHMNFKNI